jgi:hypothetical protein
MPIEYCYRYPNEEEGGYTPAGKEPEFNHKHLDAGEATIIPNYTSGADTPDELIVIACGETGQDATIHYVPPEGAFDTEDYTLLTVEDLPYGADREELEDGVIYEADVKLKDGTEVVVMLWQVEPNQISDNHIIPTGLIHNN